MNAPVSNSKSPYLVADASAIDMGWSKGGESYKDGERLGTPGADFTVRQRGGKTFVVTPDGRSYAVPADKTASRDAMRGWVINSMRRGDLKLSPANTGSANPLQSIADIKIGDETLGQRTKKLVQSGVKLIQNAPTPIGFTPNQVVGAYNKLVPEFNKTVAPIIGRPLAVTIPSAARVPDPKRPGQYRIYTAADLKLSGADAQSIDAAKARVRQLLDPKNGGISSPVVSQVKAQSQSVRATPSPATDTTVQFGGKSLQVHTDGITTQVNFPDKSQISFEGAYRTAKQLQRLPGVREKLGMVSWREQIARGVGDGVETVGMGLINGAKDVLWDKPQQFARTARTVVDAQFGDGVQRMQAQQRLVAIVDPKSVGLDYHWINEGLPPEQQFVKPQTRSLKEVFEQSGEQAAVALFGEKSVQAWEANEKPRAIVGGAVNLLSQAERVQGKPHPHPHPESTRSGYKPTGEERYGQTKTHPHPEEVSAKPGGKAAVAKEPFQLNEHPVDAIKQLQEAIDKGGSQKFVNDAYRIALDKRPSAKGPKRAYDQALVPLINEVSSITSGTATRNKRGQWEFPKGEEVKDAGRNERVSSQGDLKNAQVVKPDAAGSVTTKKPVSDASPAPTNQRPNVKPTPIKPDTVPGNVLITTVMSGSTGVRWHNPQEGAIGSVPLGQSGVAKGKTSGTPVETPATVSFGSPTPAKQTGNPNGSATLFERDRYYANDANSDGTVGAQRNPNRPERPEEIPGWDKMTTQQKVDTLQRLAKQPLTPSEKLAVQAGIVPTSLARHFERSGINLEAPPQFTASANSKLRVVTSTGAVPSTSSSNSGSSASTPIDARTSTSTVRQQAVATGDEVVKTVNLFTNPNSALTPDMQFKLAPVLPGFMDRFDGRPYQLLLADSSAGGRVAAPNLLAGFQEATGTLPNTVIFGDDRFAPYGVLSLPELRLRTNDMFAVGNAFDPDCRAGVCNTFHAAIDTGLSAIEDPTSAPYVHLIKTTAAAMKEAAEHGDTKQVLLATPATVSSGIYTRHIEEVSGGNLNVIQVAAPAFAPAVNNGDHLKSEGSAERGALDRAADDYVKLIPRDATSVWLCCTHYPALIPTIQAALDRAGKGNIKIVDPMRAQGYKVAEEYWEWKLSGGAKTPKTPFDTFMVSSGSQQDLPEIERLGNVFFNQGDLTKPNVPVISPGAYGEVTPEGLQQAIDTLPGRKPVFDLSKLLGQPNDPNNRQTPPPPSTPSKREPDLTGLPSPQTLQAIAKNEPPTALQQLQQNYRDLFGDDQTLRVNPDSLNAGQSQAAPNAAPWALSVLSTADQKSIADSFAKYQQAGGTKTQEQFFIGTPQNPGVMQAFDEAKFLRGQAPSIPEIAGKLAAGQVELDAFVTKEQKLLDGAYQVYSLTTQYHPYSDKAPVIAPEQFVAKLLQEYQAAGAQTGTGKSLGEFAVEKYPPLETSAFYQKPLEMAKRFPALPLDERDKIVSLAQKTELLEKDIIPYYKAHPITENWQKLVAYNPVTHRLEVDTNFLVFDPRANGVFPQGKKPALDLNALIGRTDRYDLPSKLVQLVIPATRPASVDPTTNNQYIRPGFEHTNNKWVLSQTEKTYLPKLFAAEPRLQAIEAQKKAVPKSARGFYSTAGEATIKNLDQQAAGIKAEMTGTYTAKRRNWAAFVIHAIEVLRLPRTEVAAMLADQQIASPPPPIGGPRGVNVPQMAGSGVQQVLDPVTGLQTVTYVDLRNIKSKDLASGDFSSADIEVRGPSLVQAVSNSSHRRGEVTKTIALAAVGVSTFNAMLGAYNFYNGLVSKRPEPLPTPPKEMLAASVQEQNRTMQGSALQLGVLPSSLDRIALPKVGLTLFLEPVGKAARGVARPTFEQIVQSAIQTNRKTLLDSGVNLDELLSAARQFDANKVPTGKGTTVPSK